MFDYSNSSNEVDNLNDSGTKCTLETGDISETRLGLRFFFLGKLPFPFDLELLSSISIMPFLIAWSINLHALTMLVKFPVVVGINLS